MLLRILVLGRALMRRADARWDEAAHAFQIPGSWAPLTLMMTMFFARYAIAVSLAMLPALAHAPAFSILASLAYGLLSGMFLARSLGILALRPARDPHSVQST